MIMIVKIKLITFNKNLKIRIILTKNKLKEINAWLIYYN